MFKCLLMFVPLSILALSTSTPAHAEALTVSNLVCYSEYSAFSCEASVSGGTGTYTSFVWGLASSQTVYYNASGPSFSRRCVTGTRYSVNLRVTDSSGAFASQTGSFTCRF